MTDNSQLQLSFDAVDAPLTAATPATCLPDAPAMADALAQHPDYRVLRRLVPMQHFKHTAQGPLLRVLVLDTETTGLDHTRDKIIELAMLRVEVDRATGLPVGDVLVYDELEDPGQPISPEIQAITGISDQMVAGHRLDEARIAELLNGGAQAVPETLLNYTRARCLTPRPTASKISRPRWRRSARGFPGRTPAA